MEESDRVLIEEFLGKWSLELEFGVVDLQPSLIDEFKLSVYRELSRDSQKCISFSEERIYINIECQ